MQQNSAKISQSSPEDQLCNIRASLMFPNERQLDARVVASRSSTCGGCQTAVSTQAATREESAKSAISYSGRGGALAPLSSTLMS